MSDPSGIKPEINPILASESVALSGQLAVLRSGRHLLRITATLREVEALMLGAGRHQGAALADLNGTVRSRLQSMDLMIQELTGLSNILIAIAPHLSDEPDQDIDTLVDLPRLQGLSQSLRHGQKAATQPQIVLF